MTGGSSAGMIYLVLCFGWNDGSFTIKLNLIFGGWSSSPVSFKVLIKSSSLWNLYSLSIKEAATGLLSWNLFTINF